MILRKLRTFRELGPDGRLLALEALVLSFVVRSGFACFGVPSTEAALRRWFAPARRPADKASSGEPLSVICSALKMQRLAYRTTGFRGTCLVRSLTLWGMLAKRGIPAELRIGIRKHADRIEGHAWLEYEGRPINEEPGEVATYVLFDKAAEFRAWGTLR